MKFEKSLQVVLMIVLLCNTCSTDHYTEIIHVQHNVDSSIFQRDGEIPDFESMLSSFNQSRELYTMTFHGNFDELIDLLQEQIMTYFDQQDTLKQDPIACTMFTYYDEHHHAFLGRNFDNRETELLVGLFYPDSGYASLGLIPLIELGFDANNQFDPQNTLHRKRLLSAPAVTVDGMNEMGVTMTVATLGREVVVADTSKPYRFLPHLTRNIMDHACDVESAINIASSYNLFDNSKHSISHHLLIADPSGRSVVLEWNKGGMHVIENEKSWQIVTNTRMYNVSTQELQNSCRRYAGIHERLAHEPDSLSWQNGMDALKSAEQINQTVDFEAGPLLINTEWSAMFEMRSKVVNICLNGQYRTVYRVSLLQ